MDLQEKFAVLRNLRFRKLVRGGKKAMSQERHGFGKLDRFSPGSVLIS
jgi:hypothetical protein